jgi:hypothetical protein
MVLPDQYIYRHVLASRAAGGLPYGRNTYYGRKFFYRTGGVRGRGRGYPLTMSVPRFPKKVADPHAPAHYPNLPDALALLDRVGTMLYQDALIPVALAHGAASIPLGIGSKVLGLLSRSLLETSQI